MIAQWKDDYSVNVKLIDDQHKRFFEILKRLTDRLEDKESVETINKTAGELEDYTKLHFMTEEGYFKRFNYGLTKPHIILHEQFLSKITYLKNNLGKDNILVHIDEIDRWFVQHICSMDKKFTRCFNDHGLR